jgi:polyhydroxybutyrate depolymerase
LTIIGLERFWNGNSFKLKLEMKNFLCSYAIGIALVACNPRNAEITPSATDYAGSLESGGISRSYQVHLPSLKTQGLPLVIALHGGSGDATGMAKLTSLHTLADQEGFVVVYPNGFQKQWADGRGTTEPEKANVNDVVFLSSLVAQLETQLGIDLRRVYATGISNGGFMTTRLACEASSVFAAVAVVAATMPQNIVSGCQPPVTVPFLLIHGTKDTFVPEVGGEMTKGNGGLIISTNDTLTLWRNINACANTPSSNTIDTTNDGTSVTLERYTNCKAGSEVTFYKVINGGHTWAGGSQYLPELIIGKTSRDINASQTIWAFFKRFSR